MNVQIQIPANMRNLSEGNPSYQVSAATVRSALDNLLEKYPDLAPRLVDENGGPQPFVNLFLDGKHIRDLEGLDTQITADGELLIVAALAGG